MKNRKLLLIVSLVLALTMSLGGTLAYLTDTDADVNVMTLGNVKIQQNEQQRVEEGGEFTSVLEPFENDKMLLPYTPRQGQDDVVIIGEHEVTLDDKVNNYIDKIVSVTNTSNTDVWVRTLVAMPTGGSAWEPSPVAANDAWLHWNIPGGADQNGKKWGDYWSLNGTPVATIAVDGVNYYVWEFTHKVAVTPDETTFPVIRGLYMDKKVDMSDAGEYFIKYDNGTEKAIANFTDSNGKVNMLVLSQAVQAAGFASCEAAMAEAFPYGTDNANVATWFKGIESDYPAGGNNPPVKVDATYEDPAEFAVATLEDGAVIALGDGNYVMPDSAKGKKNLTFVGNGKTVIATNNSGSYEGCNYGLDGSTVTFENVVITTDGGVYTGYARCSATYNNCIINNQYVLYGASEFNNCTFNVVGDNYNIRTWGAPSVDFNNCTFNSSGKALLVYGEYVTTDVVVNGCVFNDDETTNFVKAAIETGSDRQPNDFYTITVNNTKVNGFAINTTNCSDVNSTLWANKNGLDREHLNVVVDGVDVY